MATLRGGDKFEAALAKIAAGVSKPATLSVGFLEGATYPDGKSVAMVAAIQEFGAPSRGIPPRPFFRQTIASKSGDWPKVVADLLKANSYDAVITLGQAGEGIKGQIQQSIAEFSGVPLAPSTVQKKKSEKQLVDTGHLLNSVDYQVK